MTNNNNQIDYEKTTTTTTKNIATNNINIIQIVRAEELEQLQQQEHEKASVEAQTQSLSLSTTPITTTTTPMKKKRKLILHFDQHNTIQVACTLPGRRITVEEGLNNFLTSVVWGKETEENGWEWVSHEPNLTRPTHVAEAVTYFKYLEKKVVKSPEDRARLKQLTCRFVHEEPGIKFKEYFDLYLESLIYHQEQQQDSDGEIGDDENDENLYYYTNGVRYEQKDGGGSDGDGGGGGCEMDNEHQKPLLLRQSSRNGLAKIKLPPNTIPAGDPTNKELYHLILPDFFDMIRRLQKANREFSIILRTMGIDSHNFLETIKPMFECKHRDFKDLKPLKINTSIGHIKRSSDNQISLHMDNQVFSTDAEIYAKLCSLEGISAIRDDFAYWQSDEYSCYSAKPLWIDLNDDDHHHIIFDDNIRLDSTTDDCIVNIRLRQVNDPLFESVDFESYKIFEKSSILQPNLIKLLNPHLRADSTRNYYYELVRKSENVYDRILEDRHKLDIVSAKEKSDDDENLEVSSSSAAVETEEITPMDIKEINKMRRNSEDNRLAKYSAEKKFKNLKLNRSFSMRLEEAEIQIDSESKKMSTLCVIN